MRGLCVLLLVAGFEINLLSAQPPGPAQTAPQIIYSNPTQITTADQAALNIYSTATINVNCVSGCSSAGGPTTVTAGTGTFRVSQASNFTVSAGTGAFGVQQLNGPFTVTAGTGTFPVSGTFFQTTQPVSGQFNNGSYTVTPGTGTFPVSALFNSGSYTVTPGSGTFPITLGTVGLPVYSTTTISVSFASGAVTTPFFIHHGTTEPVNAFQSGTWNVNSTQVNGPYTITPSTGLFQVTQGSAWAVTPGSGTFTVSATQVNGAFTVTPGSGTYTLAPTTVAVTNVSGQNLNVVCVSGCAAGPGGPTTVTPGTGTWNTGSYTVTPGTGTFPVSGAFNSGSYSVTPASGTFNVAFTSGSVNNPLFVHHGTTEPVSAFQSGAWTVGASQLSSAYTVTPGSGVWQVTQGSNFTTTPGTGTWPVSGLFNSGSYSVTPGTGVWSVSATQVNGLYTTAISSAPLLTVTLSSAPLLTVAISSGVISTGTITAALSVRDLGGADTKVGFNAGGGSVPVVEMKDYNRTLVILSTSNMACVNIVAMSTFNFIKGAAVTLSTNSYSVTPGKRFHIQSIVFNITPQTPATVAAFSSSTFRVMLGNSITSPVLFSASLMMQTNFDTPPTVLSIPDGIDIPGGSLLGVLHTASVSCTTAATGIKEEFAIIGYE